jgi:hypothetical protein
MFLSFHRSLENSSYTYLKGPYTMNRDKIEGQWKYRTEKSEINSGKMMNSAAAGITEKKEWDTGRRENNGTAKEGAMRHVNGFKNLIEQFKNPVTG